MSSAILASFTAGLATALALLGPGLLAVRLLRLGGPPLERLSLAVATGRILFGAVALVLSAANAMAFLPWLVAGCVLALVLWRPRPAPQPAPGSWELPAALLPILAASLLVGIVVFRSGHLDAAGDLVFYGKDAVNDPLLYSATAGLLAENGLPLVSPYASDSARVGHVLFFGVLAGLRVLSATLLAPLGSVATEATLLAPFAVVFRALPWLDVTSLGIAAFALARRLGARPAGAAAAGVLVVLGGEAWALTRAAAAAFGLEGQDLLAWAFFGPLLTPVNPVAACMQTLFVAALLLVQLPALPTRGTVLAGLLVGASAELKLFGWAPALAGLVAAALLPPAGVARAARIAAISALALSLPSLLEKVLFASRLGDRMTVGFGLCPGCLPRYLLEASFGGHDLSFAVFEEFRGTQLLDPGFLASGLLYAVVFLVVVFGARVLALPSLRRGVQAAAPGVAFVQRWILLFSLAGVVLAMGVASGPHHLNAGQFLWPALFALSLELGLAIGAWLDARRFWLAGLALAIALASPALTLARMGVAAPVLLRVSGAERELLGALSARSAPDEIVLEPSWLQHPDYPAPVGWLAGRQVLLSTDAAAAYLPSYERLFRHDQLRRVFTSADRVSALRAVEATGARWIYAPAAWPLRFEPAPDLEVVASNAAGTLYRVRPR